MTPIPLPEMTIVSSPIEIIISARAAKHLRVKPVRPMSATPSHFLVQWRADLADDAEGGHWWLLTNLPTLYTFLIPRKPSDRIPSLQKAFLLRLRFALLEAAPPLEWQPTGVVPVTGNPRAVVGSMNDMRQQVAWPRQPGQLLSNTDTETYLQEMPLSAIGRKGRYAIPRKIWRQHLTQLAQSIGG